MSRLELSQGHTSVKTIKNKAKIIDNIVALLVGISSGLFDMWVKFEYEGHQVQVTEII